jgi:hypothetical protein
VCDQETSKNEEAKARYRVVESITTTGCNARKTNKPSLLYKYVVLIVEVEKYGVTDLWPPICRDRDNRRICSI